MLLYKTNYFYNIQKRIKNEADSLSAVMNKNIVLRLLNVNNCEPASTKEHP